MDEPMIIKKYLHQKLVDDFRLLKNPDTDKLLLGDVQKIFLSFPDKSPACEILAGRPVIEPMGIDYDMRWYSFNAIVGDKFASNINQEQADGKIDRLSNVEDVILNYLEAIPNKAENFVENAPVKRIDIQPAVGGFEDASDGLRYYLGIEFSLGILVYNKGL
jgi:hypothetical protein